LAGWKPAPLVEPASSRRERTFLDKYNFFLCAFVPVPLCAYLSSYKDTIEDLLGDAFMGWLMSDGYQVYRKYKKVYRKYKNR
jgi:hypothetical protein